MPHKWLFTRMAAVVHHAGAGTTAAGLRASVPIVGVPIFTDQPFWASGVAALGAGPQPVPYKTLGIDTVSATITQVVGDARFAEDASRISKLLAAEDSVAPVAAALRGARSSKLRRQLPSTRRPLSIALAIVCPCGRILSRLSHRRISGWIRPPDRALASCHEGSP